jgi:RNA polymerase sigma-70 factor, ECF subfamily
VAYNPSTQRLSTQLVRRPWNGFKEGTVTTRVLSPNIDLTGLLAEARGGNQDASDRAIAAVYAELHGLAGAYMRRERVGHTLQPTALVAEAYMRLLSGLGSVNDRKHFFAMAANAMRRVLVDHARAKQSDKRGAGAVRVTLEAVPGLQPVDIDVLALDEALTILALEDARAARVVELRFFCGNTDNEVSDILDLNIASVRRDWVYARSWLKRRLAS